MTLKELIDTTRKVEPEYHTLLLNLRRTHKEKSILFYKYKLELLEKYPNKVLHPELENFEEPKEHGFVLQPWLATLPLMQQSVLLSSVRGPDGLRKDHYSKPMVRWFRRCILVSALDKKIFTDAREIGGGSFTGPLPSGMTLRDAKKNFFKAFDELPMHYFMHYVHAAEILGYKHPNETIRKFWLSFYSDSVHYLHFTPETEEEMDKRLGDNEKDWKNRETPTTKETNELFVPFVVKSVTSKHSEIDLNKTTFCHLLSKELEEIDVDPGSKHLGETINEILKEVGGITVIVRNSTHKHVSKRYTLEEYSGNDGYVNLPILEATALLLDTDGDFIFISRIF